MGVNLRNELVERRTFVHALPERLSVLRVITTCVELFSTVVGKGDTTGSESEDLGLLDTNLVSTVATEEASVVVVIDEDT